MDAIKEEEICRKANLFLFFVGTPPLRPAAARFEKPRIVSKGFNWFVQSFRLYALIRGLENLDAPCKGDVFTFFLRRAKRTKKHAKGLRTSGLPGTIQSSVEEDFSRVFQRHEPKPAFCTKRRRKGFESVRKGGCSADARLMFFRK